MGEGKTNMFGKTYNTIGSTDSNLILKSKGDVKIQWGNKFIDLIKNGKIVNSSNQTILKTIDNSENINEDGIYLISSDDGYEVWLSIGGTKVNIANENGTVYVSFLTEQTDVTLEQQQTALKNIGFYYDTLQDIQNITAGLVFVKEDSKLYVIKDGTIQEYTSSVVTQSNVFEELKTGSIIFSSDEAIIQYPKKLTIVNDTVEQVVFASTGITYNTNVSIDSLSKLQSSNASKYYGYRLYIAGGESTLEVDNIIWRNMEKQLESLGNKIQAWYSYVENYITVNNSTDILNPTTALDTTVEGTLQYQNTFSVGDYVYIFVSQEVETTVEYSWSGNIVTVTVTIGKVISQDAIIRIEYLANQVSGSQNITIPVGQVVGSTSITASEFELVNYTIIQGDELITDYETPLYPIEGKIRSIVEETISIDVSKIDADILVANGRSVPIFKSRVPIIKYDKDIEILDRSKTVIKEEQEIPDETIHTKIGELKESDFEEQLTPIEDTEEIEEINVGIYSDNFIGLNSKLYDVLFKKKQKYPSYDKTIELPEDINDEKYNKAVPNIEWIKELIKLAVPSGTIAMYNGQSEIPEGWAVCDGTKGTPNLVGKFIKAVSTIDQIGDNESELNENNEFIITQEHLPKHSHPHKSHTHNLGGNLSGTTGSSGNLTVSLNYSDYNWGIESVQKTFVTSVTGEGVTSETGTVDGVSNIRTQGGNATGGNHTHSISLDAEGGLSLSSSTSKEETLEDSEWPNKPLKIEPRSYSLVFIMKL